MSDITDLNEFKKMKDRVKTMKPIEMREALIDTIKLVHDITSHLVEARREIKDLQRRQIVLANKVFGPPS